MRFIKDADNLLVLYSTDDFDFLLELPLGVASIKP